MADTKLEERVTWNDEARERARDPGPPNLDGSIGRCGPLWKKAFTEKNAYTKTSPEDELRAGISKMTPQAVAIVERMLQHHAQGKEPTELDPLADAAVATVVTLDDIAPYWLQRGGPKFVAEVLLASFNLTASSYGGQGGSGRMIEIAPGKGYLTTTIARWIRRALVGDTKGQGEVHAVLDAARASASLDLRIAMTIAAADREWAKADATEFLAAKKASMRYDTPNQIFEVLRDPELVTKLAQRHPSCVPVYELARDLEVAAAPAIAIVVEKDPSNEWNCEALAVLECVTSAKALAQSLGKKRGGEAARAFYKRRPDLAFVALAPIVVAEGKIAPFVKPELEAILKAHPDYPTTFGEHLDAKTRAAFAKQEQAKQTPKKIAPMGDVPRALQAWPAPRKGKKVRELPEFADASKLPPVQLDDEVALPESACDNLLALLMQSPLEDPDPDVLVVRKACEPKSLAAFAWALFEAWLAAGAPSKEGWAFTALGLLGNDDTARRLTPLIRAWPGESQHARAVTGCGVLSAIGTDVALMHLHGIAQKVKFKGLQAKAQGKIEEIARARGLSAEELADRLVPDLGLDESGSMTLDMGPRSFKVGFDHTLKPFVLDANGKKVADLPKPGKNDDADIAAASVEKWKTLKKDVKTIASTQVTRLEMAMCSQRRWTASDFQTFIVEHPLVVHLARRLVWGVFDDKGKLTSTFRVCEDRSLANDKDEALELAPNAHVGLVHRLEVEDGILARWGEVLGEYEIIQPFDQLGRAVYAPSAEEKKSSVLGRLKGVTVKTGKILGLEHRGWRKGPPQDAGWVWNMLKYLPNGFLADLGIGGGIAVGYMEGTPSEQKLDGLGLLGPSGKEAKLGDLSPTAFSELVRDLEMLRD